MNIANWRTSVFGTLALVAAFISQFPDLLEAIVDPATAKKIAAVAALVSGFLAFANAKDKQVTGNGTVNEPTKVAQPDGSNKVIAPLVAFLLIPALFLSGCATDPSGHRVYTGPTLSLNLGYNGATVGIGIVGQPSPIKAEATVGYAK